MTLICVNLIIIIIFNIIIIIIIIIGPWVVELARK
jgi:hypothetical protein